MPYVKQNWQNGQVGSTPISADRLNYLETGVEAATAAAEAGASLIVVSGGTVDLDNTKADGYLIGYKVTATTTIEGASFPAGSYIFERDSGLASGWTYRTLDAGTDVAPPAPTLDEEILADNPTTFLRFEGNATNEGSIPEVYTPTAITYGAGLGGGSQAAVFNGTTSKLVAVTGASAGLFGATSYAVEWLIKPTSFAATQHLWMQIGTWGVEINALGAIYVSTYIGGTKTTFNTTATLVAGAESHVAVNWDGTTAKIYINGTERASLAYAGPVPPANTAPVNIGYNGSANWFNGSMARAAMYRNASLTPERILAHAQAAGVA